MARVWSEDSIQSAIILALNTGKALVPFESERDAGLFRQAIYNYRLRTKLGLNLTVTVKNTTVVIEEQIIRSPIALSEESES